MSFYEEFGGGFDGGFDESFDPFAFDDEPEFDVFATGPASDRSEEEFGGGWDEGWDDGENMFFSEESEEKNITGYKEQMAKTVMGVNCEDIAKLSDEDKVICMAKKYANDFGIDREEVERLEDLFARIRHHSQFKHLNGLVLLIVSYFRINNVDLEKTIDFSRSLSDRKVEKKIRLVELNKAIFLSHLEKTDPRDLIRYYRLLNILLS